MRLVGPDRARKGSGLIVTLAVLALLSVMAVTFLALMRLDVGISSSYVRDLQAEMLTAGVVQYCAALLRDDQDRSPGRYANRVQAVGGRDWRQDMSWYQSQYGGRPWAGSGIWRFSVPGRNTSDLASAKRRYAIGPSRAVWFASSPEEDAAVGRTDPPGLPGQASFGGEGYEFVRVNDADGVNAADSTAWALVPGNFNGRDDDLDGVTDPGWTWDAAGRRWVLPPAATREIDALLAWHFDGASFRTFGTNGYWHPGGSLTGASLLPDGFFWRWAAKLGLPEESCLNVNVAGNLDFSTGGAFLRNMDGRGLTARCPDTVKAWGQVSALGWKGYPGELAYEQYDGFPASFDVVQYSPSQVDPYRVMAASFSPTLPGEIPPPRAQSIEENLMRLRLGRDGLPGDGAERWRAGWRRDGATYFKFPSPDRALGMNSAFLAADALNRNAVDGSLPASRVFAAALAANRGNWTDAQADLRTMGRGLTSLGCDTILRGKIYPTEGPPYTKTPGDWRHIDILKRVNVNLIGASGPEGLPGEDAALKTKWLARRDHERDRLYDMLKAMLRWSGTPNPEHAACQFVASLADMVDRDHDETYYAAPDGSGEWALGVEKTPVINEVVFYSGSADARDFRLDQLRFELYNPSENIPWIPDADEAYDVSRYVVRINQHAWRLGDLAQFDWKNPTRALGWVTKIGADGLFGDPNDPTPWKQSWSRFLHVGWPEGFPREITAGELRGSLRVELWKPLRPEVAARVPLAPSRVELFNGRKYICVDRTPSLFLVNPGLLPTEGPALGKGTYVGCYRRWDPMNARTFGPASDLAFANVVWCPGWDLTCCTLGAPNAGYPLPDNRSVLSEYGYRRYYERNVKIVDGDLPSLGWLGELFLVNCAQDGPLTWVHTRAQTPTPVDSFDSELEGVKFDLYRPWGNVRNLGVYDMLTVWDPSNDGIDNDGDGAVDDEDTGSQPGDRLGPEVRVYGVVDLNHAGARVLSALIPGLRPFPHAVGYTADFERGRAPVVTQDRQAIGPFETLGDLLRIDDLSGDAAGAFGGFDPGVSDANYSPFKGSRTGSNYGAGLRKGVDSDGDGIINNRAERDFTFTQVANYLTTRPSTFTIEVMGQITDPPHYPGMNYRRASSRVKRVYASDHLLLAVDRSTTLRVRADGRCDFTGPVRVLFSRPVTGW